MSIHSSEKSVYENYFTNRGVNPINYEHYVLPQYLVNELPASRAEKILDIGCGFGQTLNALKKEGYSQLKGIELLQVAVDYCKSTLQLDVIQTSDIIAYSQLNQSTFDCIIMSHVLEHLPKDTIIPTLTAIRKMLTSKGKLIVMVPNGQSPNHSYWMWEDFTHELLFTAGSLTYVLKSAGFQTITFLDPYDLLDKSIIKRFIKKGFQHLFKLKTNFWNSVNSSGYHYASPVIYTWELKVKATI